MIGIYIIRNKINGKVYIGQSWDIKKRWREHIKTGKNKHLHSSFEKYGLENFAFEVLKELQKTALTQILLDSYEKHFIEQFNSINPSFGYNKMTGGLGGKHSEDSKKKMSEINKGRIFSAEARKKMSESQIGKKRTTESIRKMVESNSKKIICLTTGEVFNSQKEAANILNIKKNNISMVCTGRRKTTGGYRFRFYVDIEIPA